MMDSTDLAAVSHVGPLQHLRNRVRAAAGELGLFVAGNHLKHLNPAPFIVDADSSGDRHLRQNQTFHRIALKEIIHHLLGSHGGEALEIRRRGIGLEQFFERPVLPGRTVIRGNQVPADDAMVLVMGLAPARSVGGGEFPCGGDRGVERLVV